MQLQGLTKTKRHGLHRALFESVTAFGQPLLLPELLGVFDVLDLRPPRDASPPFLPATRASSLVNSCAVPFWCAARPPFAAMARCACGSIAANPRGVLRVAPLVPRESAPPSFLLVPVPPPLAPPPPPAPLRSSMLSPCLLGSSAIIDLPCRDIRKLLRSRLPDVTRKWYGRSEAASSWILMRKRQAAISGRGRTACPATKMWISLLLSRV
jgi:hypothetical protein